MYKSYKYRIYPNNQQKELIEKTFGCCRLVYNLGLEVKTTAYKNAGIRLSCYQLGKQLPDLKRHNLWMNEVCSQVLYSELAHLEASFNHFFKGGGYPKYKSKNSEQSFSCHGNKRKVDFDKKTISVAKINDIPASIDRKFEGKIKIITIRKTSTNKYFASVLVEHESNVPNKSEVNKEKAIGIDLGIKSFAITSNGLKFEPNRYLKANIQRLKVLQRRASKKKKGSKNRQKANLKVALLHEKIKNKRSDYIHKITTSLVRDSQTTTFVIEDLNVKGMIKNRKLSQAISDVSFSEFTRQMQYKCDWYGKNLIQIGRFEPSSKTCNNCKAINDTLSLSDREWICANCGTLHDRDLNAAKNILEMGLNKHFSGLGKPVEPVEKRRILRSKKQEILVNKPCPVLLHKKSKII